jgi:hypothetical protein
MAYMQFPYRFLGPAAVVLGILAGAAVSWADALPWRWSRPALAAVAVAVCIGGALPLLYPPPWPDFGPVSAQTILETELNGRGIGTTSANDFLPVGVQSVPPPQPALLDSYRAGRVDKLNRATLPDGAAAELIEHGPQRDHYRVTGTAEFVFRLFTFYFPGWTAYVDGQPVEIMLSEPEGWITFWVPSGTHDVLVRLEDTPPRRLAWGITVLSLAVLGALVVWRLRLPILRPRPEPLAWRPAAALAAVALAGFGLRLAAYQTGWWRVHSTGREALVAQEQRYVPLENHVALLGFDLPQASARPGQAVPVTLYWKATAPVPVNLRVYVHLLGPDGRLWGQSDKWNPADFPTGRWPLDRYVRDEHAALLQPDAPAGVYRVMAGLWDGDTGQRMRVVDEAGQPTASDGVLLAEDFEVRR